MQSDRIIEANSLPYEHQEKLGWAKIQFLGADSFSVTKSGELLVSQSGLKPAAICRDNT